MGNQGNGNDAAEAPKKKSTLFVVLVIVGVLFGLCVVGGGVLATLLMPALLKAKLKANEVKCGNNLKQIGLAAMQYADDNRFFPCDPSDPTGRKAMDVLVTKNLIDNREVFSCPCCDPGDFSYEGFPVVRSSNARSDTPLAWDKNPHPDGTRNVLFVDCHVVRVSEADFPEILAKAKAPK